MKKFVISLIILVILGGVVFYFGWIQFRIPEGHYAVVFTKTRGYDEEVIPAGTFAWRWEALVPTNLTLHSFSAAPHTVTLSAGGSLPSARLYEEELEANVSFDYDLRVEVNYRFDAEELPALVADEVIRPDTLMEWYGNRDSAMEQQLLEIVSDDLERLSEAADSAAVSGALSASVTESLEEMYPYITVTSVLPRRIDLPDLDLYRRARGVYRARLDARQEAVRSAGVAAAGREIEQESRVERLRRYGEVLAEYPSLLEYFDLLAANGVDPLNIGELGIELPTAPGAGQ